MCHECYDEEQPEFSLEMIPEEDREDFLDFTCEQFGVVINAAVTNDILFELITEWPAEKQAMFTLASVLQGRVFGDNNE
jgi:hypothetical protein